MSFEIQDGLVRCPWAQNDPLYVAYHDQEWGVPLHDDRKLFEFLVLEAFQAGLSWLTVLRKRDNFRDAYANFDPAQVANYGPQQIEALLQNEGIIRNRAKIHASVSNAKAFMKIVTTEGSFDAWSWQFVDRKPRVNRFQTEAEVPAITAEAERFSIALKSCGFKFVGPTVVYAHMQATGMVNDHLTSCFRHMELAGQ